MQLTRGDTKKYYFQRKNKDGEVIIDAPSAIYFTVKRQYFDQDPLIQKTLDDMTLDADGTYHFTIEPTDTDGLKYGTYVFDIQVVNANVKTTIAKGNLVVTEEVTFASNEV